MIEVTLHPTPRWRDVVLEQIRIVGPSLRREALAAAVALGVATIVIGGEILRGGPGSDSSEMFPTFLVSFLIPFAVWRGEQRFEPSLFWTLPVDRRQLALAKVFAGWVWMMAALAVFVSWLFVLALISPASVAEMVMRVPYTATTATYLLGSALVLGLRHPLRWLGATAGVCFLVAYFIQPYELQPPLRSFFAATEHAAAVWRTLPDFVQWAIPTFLWLGAGLAALWAAASRHGERRRH